MVVLPKHVVLPEIPMDGNLHFEIILYLLGIVVMGLQYVNLYKTVWWLPHSHANYALVCDFKSCLCVCMHLCVCVIAYVFWCIYC